MYCRLICIPKMSHIVLPCFLSLHQPHSPHAHTHTYTHTLTHTCVSLTIVRLKATDITGIARIICWCSCFFRPSAVQSFGLALSPPPLPLSFSLACSLASPLSRPFYLPRPLAELFQRMTSRSGRGQQQQQQQQQQQGLWWLRYVSIWDFFPAVWLTTSTDTPAGEQRGKRGARGGDKGCEKEFGEGGSEKIWGEEEEERREREVESWIASAMGLRAGIVRGEEALTPDLRGWQ